VVSDAAVLSVSDGPCTAVAPSIVTQPVAVVVNSRQHRHLRGRRERQRAAELPVAARTARPSPAPPRPFTASRRPPRAMPAAYAVRVSNGVGR
jgi:hypothetical protein